MSPRSSFVGFLAVVLASSAVATAAPFDVYFRPSEKADWTFYGGRESRAAADATAADLARSTGFATKVFALGEPVGRAPVGPAIRESVTIGSRSYVRRPGLGYTPGWYRHGGGWGTGWGGGGWGGGWGGGYGGHSGSSSHHHHSSHHHSHSHHSSSHHSGAHAGAHPSHSATHAGGRGGRGGAHHSSSHHSHSHSHSHSHHSHSHHGGHHR